jgi:hypothetical protein
VARDNIRIGFKPCRSAASKFAENVQFVLHMVVLLWGFALYDVLGREVGIVNAIRILIVAVTSPVWLYWIVSLLMGRLNSLRSSMKKGVTKTDIKAGGPGMIIQVRCIAPFQFYKCLLLTS